LHVGPIIIARRYIYLSDPNDLNLLAQFAWQKRSSLSGRAGQQKQKRSVKAVLDGHSPIVRLSTPPSVVC
jgi:hypothetical protein